MGSQETVAIIGGGFAGMMVAANIIRQSDVPFSLYIIEKSGVIGKGIAYSTPEPYHLLNVPGHNMGAFADKPHHFMEWLTEHESVWRSHDPSFASLPLEQGRFYPRALYGIYLESIWQEALVEAQRKSMHVHIIRDEAVDVEITEQRTAVISLKSGEKLPHAHHVVLATGNAPVKSFAYAKGVFLCQETYIENMWAAHANSLLRQHDLSALAIDTNVVIVGTGLTMIDAFLSLRRKKFRGRITAISRHGKLPHPHQAAAPYPSFLAPENYPKTAYGVLCAIRQEIRKAKQNGIDWRAVLQTLRPVTNLIWAGLPVKERRVIAKRLLSYWNIHRHRLPSEIDALLQQEIATSELRIIPGTIYYISGKYDKGLTVSYRQKGQDAIESITADYVINCSGPETDIAKSDNPLLLKLRDKNILHIGTLRIGVELTPSGRLKGKAPDIFHAVGALVVGEKIESTAVPDIRQHAAETAARILSGTEEDYIPYSHYYI